MALATAYRPSAAWAPSLWSWRRPEWWPLRDGPGDVFLLPPRDAYPWDLRRGRRGLVVLVLAEV